MNRDPPLVEARVEARSPSEPQPSSLRATSSIQRKLSGVIVVLLVGVVASFAAVLTHRRVGDLEHDLAKKAEMYGRFVAQEAESAVAFDDRQTARDAFESVAIDEEITGMALFGSRGLLLEMRGTLEHPETTVATPAALTLVRTPHRLRALVPVIAQEGPRGALVIELTTESVSLGRSRAIWLAVVWGVALLLLALLATWFITRSFTRRIVAVSASASAVTAGDLKQKHLEDRSRDEIGVLSASFNAMLTKINALLADIQRSAREEAERLEGLVVERTLALDRRNADLRLVLDSVDQGLVTIDRDGRLCAGSSRIVDEWFGPPKEGDSVWTWLLPQEKDTEAREWFAQSWQAVIDDVLPSDLALEQLPDRCQAKGRWFALSYKPLAAGDQSPRTLIVITDVTAILARERAEEQQKELVTFVERFQRDRTSVRNFFEETKAAVEILCQSDTDPITTARLLHTLKGNCAIFGLPSVARLCHTLEDALEEGRSVGGGRLDRAARDQLAARWRDVEDRFAVILDDKGGRRFEVDEDRHTRVVDAVAASAPRERVEHLLKLCRYEPVARRLEHLAEQASILAERMHKQPLRLTVQANDLFLAPGVLSEVWTTSVHILRNAVDHGIETPAERLERGKPEAAEIMLIARLNDGRFEIEFQDRGRGIDWNRLRAHAVRLGLPAATEEDLTHVLFRDGVSTKDVATEISGRGLGMSAVRTACEQTGGRIHVTSESDRGTTICLSWPAATIDAIVSDHNARTNRAHGVVDGPRPVAGIAGDRLGGSATSPAAPLRLLLAEDSQADAELIVRNLRREGLPLDHIRVDNDDAFQRALDGREWDIVISDYNMPRFSALAALARVQERGLDLPFIIVSGAIGEDVAVAAMRAGAHDYLMKDRLERLAPSVRREVAEAKRRHEARAAHHAASEMLRQKERAESANDGKGRFLARMSHELRTPLNALIGFSELLDQGIEGNLNGRQTEFVRQSLAGGRHLLAVISDILDLSKIEAGSLELVRERVLLPTFVEIVCQSLRALAHDRDVTLSTTASRGLPTISADPIRLKQILCNLITSRIKASHPETTVRLEIFAAGDRVAIAVHDAGGGISEAELSCLFNDDFEEPHITSEGNQAGSTSLGLALTRRLVELHGGSITVESELGRGSTFTVWLPAQPLDSATVTPLPAIGRSAGIDD